METNRLSKKEHALKLTYKILTVILSIYWLCFALLSIQLYITRAHTYPLKFKETVFEYSDKYGLDRALVFAVIKVESGFDAKAKSSMDAIGLMQITLNTADYVADMLKIKEYDLYDEKTNIAFGCFYLFYLQRRFGNMHTVICAYNAGEGNVSKWLNDKEYSDDRITLKNVPFEETSRYAEKIEKTFTKYKKLYGNILDKREIFE